MSRKSLRGSRLAANLALPFVVTVAASCTVQSDPQPSIHSPAPVPTADPVPTATPQPPAHPTTVPPTTVPPTTEQPDLPESVGPARSISDPRIVVNPPPPSLRDSPKLVEPPKVTKNPTPKKIVVPPAPATGGSVFTRPDGTCIWVRKVKCHPNATCNPPPPMRVRCPAKK